MSEPTREGVAANDSRWGVLLAVILTCLAIVPLTIGMWAGVIYSFFRWGFLEGRAAAATLDRAAAKYPNTRLGMRDGPQ